MSVTLAFDVYGTLIDTQGVVSKLQELVGDKAASFSQTWRDKQLEYTFRRGLMQNYQDFSVCTSNALDYTCSFYKEHLSKQQRIVLLDVYRTLPAFNDVQQGLTQLKKAGYRLYAFSNGSADAVETLLVAAGIRKLFLGVISTNDIQSFKPNPAVYRHFLKESNTSANQAWLVSSNSFDVIGAISAGMNAAWVQRSQGAIFDPWGIEPTITVASILELNEKLADK
jgi:2-haloacid dehalogenase